MGEERKQIKDTLVLDHRFHLRRAPHQGRIVLKTEDVTWIFRTLYVLKKW